MTNTFDVLGPLRVRDRNGVDRTPSGALGRRLLAALLLQRGEVVPAGRLADTLWGGETIPNGPAALHSHVFRLRKRIPGLAVAHEPGGYRLAVAGAAIDATRFEHLVAEAQALAPSDPSAALRRFDDALGCWRGRPYADLEDTDDGRIEIERLSELHRCAEEDRLGVLLALGRTGEAAAELAALVAREPLRERPRLLLMDALSAGGRRAEALRVYDAYRLALAAELGVAPSPVIRARHEALLGLDHTDAEPAAEQPQPAGSAARAVTHDAPHARHTAAPARLGLPPRPISSFVGRRRELDELEARLRSWRLVTVLGPGGVGKTRLTVELVHRVAHRFEGGVVFCDLTTVDAGSPELATAVCAAARIEPRAGVPAGERLAEVFRHDRALLVLDNCEHVLDGTAELVEALVGSTEHLVVLATSRERLAVDGEVLFPLAPLECAPADGGAGGAHGSAARQLFADRATAVGATLHRADEALVDGLCRRLDGLPLALELAATRLCSFSLQEICDGVERSLSVLRGGRRTVARHRSLDAAVDWSYRLLDEEERSVLLAAGIFAAPFDAVDLAAVCDRPEAAVRERLATLVERSLVFRADAQYRLLETVRSAVRERLGVQERTALGRRHAQRLGRRLEELRDDLRHAPDDQPITTVRRLLPDLRQAFATATADGDVELALTLVCAGRDLAFDAMLPELMLWGEPAAAPGSAAGHPLTADALAIAALGRWKMGDVDGMGRLLERAVAESARLGLPDRYEVLGALGTEDLARGNLPRGIERLSRSLRTPEVIDDAHRLAEGGATLLICRAYAHDPAAAADAARLLEEVAPGAGVVPAAWCWYAAGESVLDADPELARQRLERAVALAAAGGATFIAGVAGASLASLAVRDGRLGDAIEQYRTLLPHWLRAGVSAPLWTMLRSAVELLLAMGADEAAARVLGAVTAPGSGNEVVGDDDRRLRAAAATLADRLGRRRLDECLAEGRSLDDAAAASEATAAFSSKPG